VPTPRGLPPKQATFVKEYLVDLNATQAAIRAGYSARTAHAQGPRLLGNVGVAAAIASATQARSERTLITADRVLEEIAAIAFAHMGQYAEWGGESVTLKDSQTVDPRAVAEVSQKVTRSGNNVGIKLHDKLGALEKLGKHLGMWTDKGEADDRSLVKAYPDSMMERAPKP
jgi:phage terminase small subunit